MMKILLKKEEINLVGFKLFALMKSHITQLHIVRMQMPNENNKY